MQKNMKVGLWLVGALVILVGVFALSTNGTLFRGAFPGLPGVSPTSPISQEQKCAQYKKDCQFGSKAACDAQAQYCRTTNLVAPGTLSVNSGIHPNAAIVVGGEMGVPFAKYKFTATGEAFTIKKLDIVVDSDNNFTDDPANDVGANNIARVGISYVKKDGTTEMVPMSLSSNKASFSGLNFYVPENDSRDLTVHADINTIEFGAVSGSTLRLGLNQQSAKDNSFAAQGEESPQVKNSNSLTYAGVDSNSMVVRKTVPVVAKLTTAATKLYNGQNDIAAVTVAADVKGAVSLKRMVFEFNATSGLTVNSLQLIRKIGTATETDITSQVSIRNRQGQDLKAGGSNLAAPGAPWFTGFNAIYVTWGNIAADQETISRGVTNTYMVRATVANAGPNENLSTYIADDLNFVSGSTAFELMNPLNRSDSPMPSVNHFIWSDNSAPQHSTSSLDWTNGKDVLNLPTSTLALTF